MDGMIFAAGLGTRLKPLTDNRPKALVEVAGKPLLEYTIKKLIDAGIARIVVNVHHYAGQICEFLEKKNYFGHDIVISDESGQLLDTGGGLQKARPLFHRDTSVLIHNVDIYSEVDLKALIAQHTARQQHATLVTAPGGSGRGLRLNDRGILKGWENTVTGEQKIVDEEFYDSRLYRFCGVQIVSHSFLQHIEKQGTYSIIDEYLRQAKFFPVSMFSYPGPFLDLGTPQAIEEANRLFCN